MGLDVYLYHYTKPADLVEAENERVEAEALAAWSAAKGERDYSQLTDADRDECLAAQSAVYERNGWVKGKYSHSNPAARCIEQPSAKHPDHMFKVGYFRSSYNEGGIERVLANNGVPGLYAIFGVGDDDYRVTPNWTEALRRARVALAEFQAKNDGLSVQEVRSGVISRHGGGPQSAADALISARIELSKEDKPFGGNAYSNARGDFFPGEPQQVVAIIQGKPGFLGTGVYLITKGDGLDWYEQALEIVVETCEYVLAQPDPQNYVLHWSA